MNKRLLSIIGVCACLALYGQDDIYLQTDFDKGIPDNFTLIDNDEIPVNAGNYQNVDLSGSWAANQIDVKGNYAAFSFSRCNYDFPSDNWMITPGIRLDSEQACLKWDAKSVHYEYGESYKVMISTTGTDIKNFKEIYTVDKESYYWKTHVVPLASYAHEKVYIAFVCTSRKQFILAMDNLYIGDLKEVAFATTDESRRFSGDTGTAPVRGKIRNLGKAVELKQINCIAAQGNYSQECERSLSQPGDEVDFNFLIPVTVNEVSHYKLEAEMTDGSICALHEDSIICSYYPRTLLAEKATACWCNNCPVGNLVVNRLKARFNEEAILIEVHSNDLLQCSPYLTGISRWLLSYPSFIYNRQKESVHTSITDEKAIKNVVLTPTTALVNVRAERSKENAGLLAIRTQTEFALDYENASGLYKIGYAIIQKGVQGITQKNSSSLLGDGEYYYLPYNIPGDIYKYHNIPREGSTAFKGVDNSLPSQIEAGKKYEFTHSLSIPDDFVQSDGLSVVAFVMNTVTGVVLNAACSDIPAPLTGNAGAAQNDKRSISIFKNGDGSFRIRLMDQAPYTVELIGLDGRVVGKKASIPESSVVTVRYPDNKGCYLLRVNQLNYCFTQKIILY